MGERRANETTLAMYFVTTQMGISSFKIDYESVRQSINTKSY